MKRKEFVDRLRAAAEEYRTLYVMGCFGAPMTERNKARYCNNHPYNKKPERTAMILAATDDTFGFDCVCLIKGILWGWDGDKNAVYGGAKYESNDVPDIGTETMVKVCYDVSDDFSVIEEGELVAIPGHIGIYVGDGLVVECSPKWGNDVQYTAVGNIGKKKGYNTRTWDKHGKLPYVDYGDAAGSEPKRVTVSVPVIKKGVKGEEVRALQALLNMRIGAELQIDGSCGGRTEAAIRAFQKSRGLSVDGSCGGKTWEALIG